MSIRFRFVFLDRDKHFLVVDTDLVRAVRVKIVVARIMRPTVDADGLPNSP